MVREDQRLPVAQHHGAIRGRALQGSRSQAADNGYVLLGEGPGVATDVLSVALVRRPYLLQDMNGVIHVP